MEKDNIKILNPENTKIIKGDFDSLLVIIDKTKKYYGVFAISAFPVINPFKFISLFYQDKTEKTHEIGIIEEIDSFSPEEKNLVLDALKKYYFFYEILHIFNVKLEFGMLFFEVETDKGNKNFAMRWEQSKAVDYGRRGKILLDVFEDRYIIPDIQKLPGYDKMLFTRFIYW